MKKIYTSLSFVFTLFVLFSYSNVSAQNLLVNPGFESGQLAPWFGDNSNTVTIFTDDVAEGTYAAEGNAAQNVDLVEGHEYKVTCKAKIIQVTGEQKVWIGVRSSQGLVQNSRIWTENAWEDMVIEFTAPESGPHKFWIWGQGDSRYASDDWELIDKTATSVDKVSLNDNIHILNKSNVVEIILNNQFDADITVSDFSGRKVYQEQIKGKAFVDNTKFPVEGIYVITVSTKAERAVKKVFVSRR